MNLTHHILPIMVLCLLCEYTLFANNGIADEEKNTSKLNVTRSFQGNEILNQVFEQTDTQETVFAEKYSPKIEAADLTSRRQIDATLNKVISENRFVKFLDENAVIDLPIGIKSEIGNLTYIILVDSLILTPQGAFLFASMAFDAPKIGRIHFRSAGIKFTKTGGIADIGVLELVGDYGIDIGHTQRLMLNGSRQQTFVEMDCYGFRQMSLDASLVLSREKFLPEDNDGKVLPEQNVALNFTTILSDWNDLLVAVDVPRFQVVGLKGFSFEVRQATLDLSDLRNAPSVLFPANYRSHSPYLRSGNSNLWQGVYINQVAVHMPRQFETTADQRPSLNGYHLLIDDQGFSGIIAAENVVSIEQGKIGNWDFSLDAIDISLVANEVRAASLTGSINIPLNKVDPDTPKAQKEKQLFQYTASILPGNEYLFNVSNPEEFSFKFWQAAEVRLDPASHVLIRMRDDKFFPVAHLHGEMSIKTSLREDQAPETDEKKQLQLTGVAFQDLVVQSVKPYVQVGAFSFGSKASRMGGYPLQITRLGAGYRNDELFLDVAVALSLTGSEGGSFGAAGGLRIIASEAAEGTDLTYTYKALELTRFKVDIDQGAIALKGDLQFFRDDPVYGQGLNGTVDAQFMRIGLQTSAIFGTKDGLRYWYADAMVQLPNGIPIVPGMYLNRFGGGASYHMRRISSRPGSPLIASNAGLGYVPDETAGLGLKAIAGLKGQNGKVFHAEALLEMNFRKAGGLRNIQFTGNAFLLSGPQTISPVQFRRKVSQLEGISGGEQQLGGVQELLGTPDMQGAQVFGGVLIHYDFDHRTLHANLKTVIQVAQGAITGGGEAVLHFAPDEWYIYVGRPNHANRIKLNLLGLAEANAYFVMGSTVPDTPPPPENVSAILGGIDLDYMSDLNALSSGQGIGFGASLSVDTGNKTFLIFYGRFQAGVGFDVMMRDYGGASCSGRGPLGIGGWYANGQAYAYFDGNIGVQVRLFKIEKNIEILKIGAAVIAQAKLPNPVWIKGTVGGHFNVLGGLVKGKCSFEVTIGEECEMQNESSVLEGVSVIAQLTPQDGNREVDVFTTPQAVFNYEMETAYQMMDLDNRPIEYRMSLDKTELRHTSGVIEATVKWNGDKTVAVLQTNEMLPAHSQLEFDVLVSLQEKRQGRWQDSESNGKLITEQLQISFTTGEAPDHISPHNIAYAYPLPGMLNLYKAEHPNGYIKLMQGQDYLFSDPVFSTVVRFQSSTDRHEVPVSYDASNNQVNFTFPSLRNGTVYDLTIVNIPKVEMELAENVFRNEQQIASLDATIATREATGSIKNYEEQTLYQSVFRTSIYNTFSEKLSGIQLSNGWRYPLSTGVHLLGSNFSGQEPFSLEELSGRDGSGPMIRLEADLTRNQWFYSRIFPLLYQHYPLPGGLTISPSVRDVEEYGLIPVKAVRFNQYPRDFRLEEQSQQVDLSFLGGTLAYYLAYFINQDYRNLKNQAGNYIYKSGSANDILKRLVQSSFPSIEKGNYVVDVGYYLPGQDRPNTTFRHSIYNPLN